jgi:hypothetical protein
MLNNLSLSAIAFRLSRKAARSFYNLTALVTKLYFITLNLKIDICKSIRNAISTETYLRNRVWGCQTLRIEIG